MPEGYINVLFQKGLVLDDIIKLLNIKKIDMQQPRNAVFTVMSSNERIEMKVMPLYVLTDINGKQYFI